MKRNKFLYIAIGFVLLAFITAFIYYRGKHRHPFRYELDVTSLSAWFEDLTRHGGDYNGVTILTAGPYNFDNETDLGRDSLVWSKKEDEYFIVYYPSDMNPKTGSYRANNCLQVAHEAIADLERIMGRYYYPSDVMDGRKLCIYLPDTPSAYGKTVNDLLGRPTSSANSIGMTITAITQCGPSVLGIVIHPDCFDPDASDYNGYRSTLRHEMAHYVFHMSLNYGKSLEHPLWVSEGIADFVGSGNPQLSGADTIQFIAGQCFLDEDFPSDGPLKNAAYWAGESFYKFLSDTCGRRAPTEFLLTLYEEPLETGLSQMFPNVDPKEKWLESLRQSDTLSHPEYLLAKSDK